MRTKLIIATGLGACVLVGVAVATLRDGQRRSDDTGAEVSVASGVQGGASESRAQGARGVAPRQVDDVERELFDDKSPAMGATFGRAEAQARFEAVMDQLVKAAAADKRISNKLARKLELRAKQAFRVYSDTLDATRPDEREALERGYALLIERLGLLDLGERKHARVLPRAAPP